MPFLLLWFSACTEVDTEVWEDTAVEIDTAAPEAITPTWGAWNLFVHDTTFDSCEVTAQEDLDDPCSRGCGPITLAETGTDTFTMSSDEWQDYELGCALDSSGYVCEPLTGIISDAQFDAEVEEWDAVIGTFPSTGEMRGTYTFTRTCVGPDCDAYQEAANIPLDCTLMGRVHASYTG